MFQFIKSYLFEPDCDLRNCLVIVKTISEINQY